MAPATAPPTTGTAICPYCAGNKEKVYKDEHIITAPLVTDLNELLRHRDESNDRVIDLTPDAPEGEKLTATRPKMQTVVVDGLSVSLPTGLRPIIKHPCPATLDSEGRRVGAGHTVTLYCDDVEKGGKVQ